MPNGGNRGILSSSDPRGLPTPFRQIVVVFTESFHMPVIFDPTIVSADCGLPSDQKHTLRAPEILSPVTLVGKYWHVTFKDHADREWTLAANTKSLLKYELKYFRALDRTLIKALFDGLGPDPGKPIKIKNWQKVKGWRCLKCKSVARVAPDDVSAWGCSACETTSTANNLEAFEEKNHTMPKAKKKEAADAPTPEPVVEKKPAPAKRKEPAPPVKNSSLRDLMRSKKKPD